MTIKDLNRTIEVMRRVYPFDDMAEIRIGQNYRTNEQNLICVKAVDYENNTVVHLEKEVEYESNS